MATRMRVVCSVFCLTVWAFAVSADACDVNITFPTTDVTLQAASSSPTLVRFDVVVNRCNESLGKYRLEVMASEGKNPQMRGSVYQLGVMRPDVNKKNYGCKKKEQGLNCHVRDTFPRRPLRTWQIRFNDASSGSSQVEHVYFSVLYPTILEKFYISNHEGNATVTMNEGDTAQFQCHGNGGNPSDTVLLRGPQNNILASQDFEPSSTSYFTFSKKRLSCSDSGQYRCEVNGTDQYRALTLLVRCPMEFKERDSSRVVINQTGGDARISFEATSYTMDISPCMLSTPAGKGMPCKSKRSDVTVTGSLPDVVITLKLTDVTEQDLGVWALFASNPTGSGTLRFHLSDTDQGPELSSLWTAVSTTITLQVLIVIVLLILIIWVWWKRSRIAGSPDASGSKPQLDSDEDYLEPVPHRVERSGLDSDDADGRNRKSDSDEEYLEPVPWRVRRSDSDSDDADGRKRKPPDSDEDYLEPVPHRVERSDLDSDDADGRSRKPQGSDGDYQEPEPRRVEQTEPCSSKEPDYAYSEVNPATMIDAARVPAPGANRQRELYESLRMAEVGERSMYSSIGKHGNQASLARVTAPANKCIIQ